MHPDLLSYLACPEDGHHPLASVPRRTGPDGAVSEGDLRCPACGRVYPIRESIPCFIDPPGAAAPDDGVNRLQEDERRARDDEAARYGRNVFDNALAAELEGIRDGLRLEPGHALLDLGCGTGTMTLALAPGVRDTVALDFSFESLRFLARRMPGAPGARIFPVQADVFRLPLRAGSFDRVVSIQVFEHLPGLQESGRPVREVARVLKAGGRFVVTLYNYSTARAVLARLLPFVTYGGGYQREGSHAGRIYFRRYDRDEVEALLAGPLDVVRVGGLRVVPKAIMRRGGAPARRLERALQRLGVSSRLGYFLMATALKPAETGGRD